MLKTKKGVSALSLVLCTVVVGLVVVALIVATNNSAAFRAQLTAKNQSDVVENSAYTKVYSLDEVKAIARQSFANNYILLYEGQVDMTGFEALIIGEMEQQIPARQLTNYNIFVTQDGIEVQSK